MFSARQRLFAPLAGGTFHCQLERNNNNSNINTNNNDISNNNNKKQARCDPKTAGQPSPSKLCRGGSTISQLSLLYFWADTEKYKTQKQWNESKHYSHCDLQNSRHYHVDFGNPGVNIITMIHEFDDFGHTDLFIIIIIIMVVHDDFGHRCRRWFPVLVQQARPLYPPHPLALWGDNCNTDDWYYDDYL